MRLGDAEWQVNRQPRWQKAGVNLDLEPESKLLCNIGKQYTVGQFLYTYMFVSCVNIF